MVCSHEVGSAADWGKNSAERPILSVADACSVVVIIVVNIIIVMVIMAIFVFVPIAAFIPVIIFVVVAIAVTNVLACNYFRSRPPHNNSKAGGVGAAAARNVASLLPALVIAIVVPVFALALWMPSLLLFEDSAAGTGIFNNVGAEPGTSVVTIVGVFVNNAVHGTDQVAISVVCRTATRTTETTMHRQQWCVALCGSPPLEVTAMARYSIFL